MIIGDVGQNNIEKVDLGVAGKNYGWNRKEGTFLFDPTDGTIGIDPIPIQNQLVRSQNTATPTALQS